jgi:3-phosphoshikimate 1-carboxyvinyltransferase
VSLEKLVVRRGGGLSGRVQLPGDKSISHRALILGGIADGVSRVENFLPSADCVATMSLMRALGVEIEEESPTTLVVHGRGLRGLREPDDVLDCARSGTSMRLLAGLLAGQPFLSVLSGDGQLLRRPMGRIIEPLGQMGAQVLARDGGRLPPLAIHGGSLHGIEYALPVASAQVKSALLLAGLYAEGPTTLSVPGPARDHTERMLQAMGVSISGTNRRMQVDPAERLEAVEMTVPGDMSSAAFLLVAATLVPGSEIMVQGVGVNPTRTGLLDVLAAMRADVVPQNERMVSGEPVADLAVRSAELRGAGVGGALVVRAIDEFPVLAVAATQAHGDTIVRDAAELRVKETDRIATTVEELRRMGAQIEARPDGFAVHGPTPLRGAEVHSHGDHRLGMALAVAGLVARGETLVRDTECIGDSFPGFSTTMVRLGGQLS